MSKEKLQEVREKWTNKETEGDTSSFFNLPYITHDDVVELMKLAYNQALNDAANNAKTFKNSNSGSWRDAKVDEQSILKLKI